MVRSTLAVALHGVGSAFNRWPAKGKYGRKMQEAAGDLLYAPGKLPWSGSSRL
jgi:hypothetical protein